MKTENKFVIRQLGEEYVVVPVGENAQKFQGMIRLNESGALLWRELEKGVSREQMAQALQKEYEVSESKAQEDVRRFLQKLEEAGILD